MPPRFWTWLAAAALAQLGTQALAFGTTWAAAGSGPGTAAVVLSATVLPRVVLALPGGAVADRVGAWRVLAAGYVAVLAVALALAVATHRAGPLPAVLVAAALALGVVDAATLPAAGALPRLLVPAAQLARVQAVLLLAQSVPLVVTNGVLGALAVASGPGAVVAGCGAVLAGAGGLAARSHAFRADGVAVPSGGL